MKKKSSLLSAIIITVICSLLFSSCVQHSAEHALSQEQSAAIEKLIDKQKALYHLPGIAVAIIQNGAVVKKIVSGQANVEANTPVTESTSFQLASTTKSFTATAVLSLVKDGSLHLSDPIGNILTDLPPTWKNVTVRQLLSHTSGLPDITRTPGQLDLIANSWESILKIIYVSPFQFKPGEQWAYTQTNYVLLSLIIEKISGMSFEKFMNERLFKPLNMNNTFFTDSTKSIAANYSYADEKLANRDLTFPQFSRAAGGLYSSLEDLIKWNNALDAEKILPAELSKEMWSAITLNDSTVFRVNGKTVGYGLGWVVEDAPYQRAVGHSGGNSTAYRRFIDEKFTIIVLHNGVQNPDDLIEAIAFIMRSKPGEAGPTAQARLWEASKTGDTAEIIAALKDGADINQLDTSKRKSGRRALNYAALLNQADAIRILLKNGANINAATVSGLTPLHHAAESGSLKAAKLLLESGANPNLTNKAGAKPADIARSNNHPEIANLIDSFIKK